MAYITKQIYEIFKNVYEERKDPRVLHLPLVGSPVPMVISIAVYLAFVLYFGPKWMEKRKPYNLKYIMRIYNAIQVIANFILLLYGFQYSYLRKEFSFLCQPIDHTNNEPWMQRLLLISYGYYITKYVDLFDTIFFILRKKYNQITFLHVYHHAGMVFAVYVFMTFLAGSHSTMLGLINLLVHTIMYSYYFVTSLRPVKQALWWKRHITQLQLFQFGYLMLHFLVVLLNNTCQHPLLVTFVGLSQNLFMFLLFADFYYKAYIKKAPIKNISSNTNDVCHKDNNSQNQQHQNQQHHHLQKQQQQQQQQQQQLHQRQLNQHNHIGNNCNNSSLTTTSTKCKLV